MHHIYFNHAHEDRILYVYFNYGIKPREGPVEMSSRGQKQTKWWLDHEMKKNMEIYVHELQVYREKFGLKTYPYLDKNGDVYQLEFNEWMNIIEKSKLNKFLEFLVMNSNSEYHLV